MEKRGFYWRIMVVFIVGLILGAAVPSSVIAHKSGTIEDRIGGYNISELEKELGAEEYGHDCYENEDYILLIFYAEEPKAYPEVSKVTLVLYDKNNKCFSDDHEKAFELYREWYLKEHKKEISDKFGKVIEGEGFMEAIINLEDWASESGELPSFIEEGLKAAGLEALSYIIGAPIGTLYTLISIAGIPFTADHALSDFESVQETEKNRINKLSDDLEKYDDNPSQEDLRSEILNVEGWKIGVYKDTYIDWRVIPPKIEKGYEETEELTWNQVFTYYGDNKRAEGWFADGTAIDICYANVTGGLWVTDAAEAKNKAVEIMAEFVNNPTQENYRDAWIQLLKSADLIRISYIFKSMVHSQWAHYTGSERYLYYEPSFDSQIILPYPYSPALYDVQGYYYNPEGAGMFAQGSWEDIPWPFDENNVYDAIDAGKNASYWKETSDGIIRNYLLLSGKLADNTELFVPGEENKADLTITSLSWSPEEPEEGEEVTFSYTIKNQGAGEAGKSRTALFIDGEKVCEDDVNSLDPGSYSKETFGYRWKATVGMHEIRVVGDYYGDVEESDEGNNEMRKMLLTGEGDITKLIDEFIAWWNENKEDLFKAAHEFVDEIFKAIDELISEYKKEK